MKPIDPEVSARLLKLKEDGERSAFYGEHVCNMNRDELLGLVGWLSTQVRRREADVMHQRPHKETPWWCPWI